MKQHDFSKVSLMLEGVNSQLSDIDFYDQVRKAVKDSNNLSYDVTLPNYFRKNQYIQSVFNALGFLQASYFTVLENILDLNGMKLQVKASVFPLLDSLRNSFLGRLQHPHSYFMDVGCHSITLVTHGYDGKPSEQKGRVQDFMRLLERMVRISD